MKNSNGIEPATFRFMAQHLNHCATAAPHIYIYIYIYMRVCVCVCVCEMPLGTRICEIVYNCMKTQIFRLQSRCYYGPMWLKILYIIRPNDTANGVLCGILHRFYHGILYGLNIIGRKCDYCTESSATLEGLRTHLRSAMFDYCVVCNILSCGFPCNNYLKVKVIRHIKHSVSIEHQKDNVA